MKRAVLVAVGSQGDVEPCLALGRGLIDAGWSVRLGALAPFGARAAALGLEFHSLGELPARFRTSTRRRPTFSGVLGRVLFWSVYQRLLADYLPAFEEACRGADVVVHTGLAFPAYHLAEAHGIPCAALSCVPGAATAAFAHPLFAGERLSLGPRRNLASYALEQQLMVQSTAHLVAYWRRRLGLAPVARGRLRAHRWEHTDAFLCAVSPALLPRPADWGPRLHQTGFLHAVETPPRPELRAFLDAGDAPVYVGFGSMTARDGERTAQAVAVALGRLGLRGVLARGWGGLAPERAPHLCVVDDAPHGWLFQRVRAVVHHGGAGTTAAALRAGRVSVVVPFDYDQRFWGRLLVERGLGPAPLPREQLDANTLERALRSALDTPSYAAHLAPLVRALRHEDGVREAIRVLDSLVEPRSRGS